MSTSGFDTVTVATPQGSLGAITEQERADWDRVIHYAKLMTNFKESYESTKLELDKIMMDLNKQSENVLNRRFRAQVSMDDIERNMQSSRTIFEKFTEHRTAELKRLRERVTNEMLTEMAQLRADLTGDLAIPPLRLSCSVLSQFSTPESYINRENKIDIWTRAADKAASCIRNSRALHGDESWKLYLIEYKRCLACATYFDGVTNKEENPDSFTEELQLLEEEKAYADEHCAQE